MQEIEQIGSKSEFVPPLPVPHQSPSLDRNLYRTLQQEVDFGAQALARGSADMAVTLYQSALQKLTAGQPFYDHLVHNLLLSYKLLIEKLLQQGDTATALDFLNAAVRLEIRGEMTKDATFLRRFGGIFHGLGIAFFQHNLNEASLVCCRKAISVYPTPGAYVNLTNSLAATGQPAELSDFTTEITPEQNGRHLFIACVPKSAS
jgi:tetratricopeptide (TPR) repeat protein